MILIIIGTLFLGYIIYNFYGRSKKSDFLNAQTSVDYDVVICGGGATGILLAIQLKKQGLNVLVIEKRVKRTNHSKAIGIHPISLEIFEKMDIQLVNSFLRQGLKVFDGICLGNGYDNILGRLKLDIIQKPYNFILSIEQYKTEQILRDYYKSLGGEMRVGCELSSIYYADQIVTVEYLSGQEKSSLLLKCHFLVGCDGKESQVRKFAGITQTGSSYLDTFMMGDFDDNTNIKQDAAICLADHGLVESFPLPSGLRRWVCSTDSFVLNPTITQIADIVKDRTKYDISQVKNYMISSYQVSGMVSDVLYRDRSIIVGDAAHVCSPLGGQGMNLGFIGVELLSQSLKRIFNCESVTDCLNEYNKVQRLNAKAAVARSETYMLLGRKPKYLWVRNIIVWALLIEPLQYYFASFVSMRYLGYGSLFGRTLF